MASVRAAEFGRPLAPPPFPLQGAKRGQAPLIVRLVPPGEPRLIEPFCGSAAVSIAARRAGVVGEVAISDANPALMALWAEILRHPMGVAQGYERVWSGQFTGNPPDPRGHFDRVRQRVNDAAQPDPAEVLYLLYRIVKGALRYGRDGRMNQSADTRRAGARPAVVAQRLVRVSAHLEGAHATVGDWWRALEAAGPDDLLYLDPPYQGTSATRDGRYIAGLAVEELERGLRLAVDRGLSAIVSYDALRGPALYGRPLDPALGLLAIDVVTGVSAQETLLGRRRQAHEALYLSPALVDRLDGPAGVARRLLPHGASRSEWPLS